MKTGRLVTVPLTAKQLTLSRPEKVWNTSSKIVQPWFNSGSTVILLSYENTFCKQRKQKWWLYSTISSSLHQCSAILESMRWTQTTYAVLCQPHHTDTLFSFVCSLIRMKNSASMRLNHCWALTVLIVWQSMGQSRVFIKSILNCFQKTNKAFTDFKWHGGKVWKV